MGWTRGERVREHSSEERVYGEEVSSSIAAALEEDIVFGRLLPRERLIEEDIAQRFEAKRHLVREAIAELQRLGLVERVRNKGAFVRVYTAAEVSEINAVRELTEAHAASIIPLPMAPAAIEELCSIQARHSAGVRDNNAREVFRANLSFHSELFSHCGNRTLIEIINGLAQKSHAYRSIFVSDADYLAWAERAHLDMIDAIRRQDRDRLVTLCAEHLAPARDRYIEVMARRGGA